MPQPDDEGHDTRPTHPGEHPGARPEPADRPALLPGDELLDTLPVPEPGQGRRTPWQWVVLVAWWLATLLILLGAGADVLNAVWTISGGG
ncbi:hypothetical protein [Actinomycetospora flava]|uniref:Uncharacterized protein n=1 Tax=Actinomycetospora flava TaxID=3129232 RepID=A0ABU8MFH6_9PSEU